MSINTQYITRIHNVFISCLVEPLLQVLLTKPVHIHHLGFYSQKNFTKPVHMLEIHHLGFMRWCSMFL